MVHPMIFDHIGEASSMTLFPDPGVYSWALTIEHPVPFAIKALCGQLAIERLPEIAQSAEVRYRMFTKIRTGMN